MKALSRQLRAAAVCLGLLLAGPAAAYASHCNVCIDWPTSDQNGLVYYTVTLCNWHDFWHADQQVGEAGDEWSWSYANINWFNTEESDSWASTPAWCEWPGYETVQATYAGYTSPGVFFEVARPGEATGQGWPECDYYTNGTSGYYEWGGYFSLTYTYTNEIGNVITAGGLWWVECCPSTSPGSCYASSSYEITTNPILVPGDGMIWDHRAMPTVSLPTSACSQGNSVEAQLSANPGGPWSCTYSNSSTIYFAPPVGGDNYATVTTVCNGIWDSPCYYQIYQ